MMKERTRKQLWLAAGLIAAFILWTVAIQLFDVRPIGPNGSSVGFARLNGWFFRLTGVHMGLYTVTDWLGLVPIVTALGFAILGLTQWIRRRRFLKVDGNLLALGGFYLLVMAAYVLFEYVVINRRPVLINGYLEASYPSSTTMLVLCVMLTALLQWNSRIQAKGLKLAVSVVTLAFSVFMVAGRLICGVHWVTDIIGGALLSAGLILLYAAAAGVLQTQGNKRARQPTDAATDAGER